MAGVQSFDVIVVGGGVGGSSAGAVLARAGLAVLVLEREVVFRDRVRGEWMAPWGVAELDALGLRYVAERVPFANWLTRGASFDETMPVEVAEASTFEFANMLPGVGGCLSLGHAELQQQLLDEAIALGALVVRGVNDVVVTPGSAPVVTYSVDGNAHSASARLVIAADGRESKLRRLVGIELESTTPRVNLAGMLVEGIEQWPQDLSSVGVEENLHFLIFPQAQGRMRLYAAWDAGDIHRFSGPERQRRFLDAFSLRCVPGSEEIVNARPVGPCVTVPMTDTWSDTVAGGGVVLIGDAAGWSDPTVGQGLSVTFRDVHLVTEIMLSHPQWTTSIFDPYAIERSERMRRLRFANASVGLNFSFGSEARAKRVRLRQLRTKDPMRYQPLMPLLRGPWRVPDEAFTDGTWRELIDA
jgi:2-polyprenyl-6-methoxyphenol hydroxylase-like FAD-dependent oxidoreductase